MTTAVISIGRNVDVEHSDGVPCAVPMDRGAWDRFKRLTLSTAVKHGPVYFDGQGEGSDGTDGRHGRTEQSYTVVLGLGDDGVVLRRRLGDLARAFGQRSIALTIGETVFASGDAPPGRYVTEGGDRDERLRTVD